MKKILLMALCIFLIVAAGCKKGPVPAEVNKDYFPPGVTDLSKKTLAQQIQDNLYVPKAALMETKFQVSRLYVEEIEKLGIKYFTIIRFKLPKSFVILEGPWGEWPISALLENGKELEGKVYLYTINRDGDFWGEARIFCKKEKLQNAKLLLRNRDAGFFYGLETRAEIVADIEEFDKSEKYRKKFYEKEGSVLPELSEEILVGSIRWYDYANKEIALINAGKLLKYTIPDGEQRVGMLPPEIVIPSCTKLSDWSDSQRAFKEAGNVTVGLSSFFGYVLPARIILDLINGVTSRERTGLYMRSNNSNHELYWVIEAVSRLTDEAKKGNYLNKV